MSHPWWTALVATLLSLAGSSAAWACPACGGRESDGMAFYLVLGTMILFPFMVVGLMFPVIRRLSNGQSKEELS